MRRLTAAVPFVVAALMTATSASTATMATTAEVPVEDDSTAAERANNPEHGDDVAQRTLRQCRRPASPRHRQRCRSTRTTTTCSPSVTSRFRRGETLRCSSPLCSARSPNRAISCSYSATTVIRPCTTSTSGSRARSPLVRRLWSTSSFRLPGLHPASHGRLVQTPSKLLASTSYRTSNWLSTARTSPETSLSWR